ncbi:hypothetical protein [Cohaesibacter celericrescens]|uniref:hypothetical protein n=1 Tax=Cohaesibacter celericrescens TaxID=2067669 RepID=UPI003566C7E7
MKRHGLTLSFLLVSTALVQAQSDAEQAFQAMVDDINSSGLVTMQVGSTHYQADADQLTAQNVVYELNWDLPNNRPNADGSEVSSHLKVNATFKIPTLTAQGLSLENDGISYEALTYIGNNFAIHVDLDGTNNDMSITGKATGNDRVVHGFQPFIGEFKIAPSRPIGSIMDYIRPLILKPKYEKFSSDGYTTTQTGGNGVQTEKNVWGPTTVNGLSEGKLTSLVIGSRKGEVSFEQPMGSAMGGDHKTGKPMQDFPTKLTYEVGESRYEGYDISALLATIDPAMPPLEGTTNVIKLIDIGPVKASLPGLFEFSAEPSIQKDFTVKQPASFIVPLIDELLAQDKVPQQLPVADQEKLIKAGFDFIRSFAMGLIETGEIKADIMLPKGPYEGLAAKISLDKTRLSNLDSNGIEEISVSGLSYAGPPEVTFSLGRFAIEKLEFPDYLHIEKVIKTSLADREITASDGAKLAPNAFQLSLSDLSYQDSIANAVSAKEIRTELDRKGLAIPAYLNTKIDNLTISKSLIGHPLASVLMSQLGMDKLTLNEEITLKWDEAGNTFILEPMNIQLADIIELDASIGFGGILRSYMEDPESAQAAMATGSVLPSYLTLYDLGGVSELINLAGGMTGMGPDQVRDFAAGQVQSMLSAFTKPEFASEVAEQVKIFLKDPENLEISLDPEAPVPVAQILGVAATAPTSIPDTLAIEIIANTDK